MGLDETTEAKRTWLTTGVLPALLALVGVVVGAALTSGATYFGDRAEREDRQSERRADFRVAKRLVVEEIALNIAALEALYESGHLLEPIHTRDWALHRNVLARHLDDLAWTRVVYAYSAVEINQVTRAGECAPKGLRKLAWDYRGQAVKAIRSLDKAYAEALERARPRMGACPAL